MASIISAGTTSGTSLNLSADTSGVLQLATNGTTTAVTIDTSQNVGIGTASPAQKLHVVSSSSTYIQVQNTGNSVNAYYGVDTGGGWMGTSTNHYAAFYTNNTERMRIDSSGNVGVGTTAIGAALTVAKSNSYAGGLLLGQAAVASGYLWTTDNLYIKPNTNANTSTGEIYIQSFAGANRITLSPTNGTIAIGGATPASTGSGITFPATQSASSDANTLDDYEEGSWTPGISAANGSGGTVSASNGTYTKIGNTVFIEGNISVNSLGTLSGAFYVTGLPFTANAGFGQSQGAVRNQGINDATYGNVIVIEAVSGQSFCRFHWPTNTSNQQVVQVSSVSTNDFFAFGLFYRV